MSEPVMVVVELKHTKIKDSVMGQLIFRHLRDNGFEPKWQEGQGYALCEKKALVLYDLSAARLAAILHPFLDITVAVENTAKPVMHYLIRDSHE